MDKEELKKKLNREEYEVLVNKGTEMPFSGELLHEKRSGTYMCKVCGTQLFKSDAKFDSGSGWPSFDQALPGAVKYHEDVTHGMSRIEVICGNCGAHLGHKFPDGPRDTTGERYCINSVCLDFKEGEQGK